MITPFGDEPLDEIKLSNGYVIKIDFARDKKSTFGEGGWLYSKGWRVQLYDDKGTFVSQTIGLNPLYKPDISYDDELKKVLDKISDPNIIY